MSPIFRGPVVLNFVLESGFGICVQISRSKSLIGLD